MEFKFNVGDTVTILDGKFIYDYAGSFSPTMCKYIGKTAKVISQRTYAYKSVYQLDIDEGEFYWDERGLVL